MSSTASKRSKSVLVGKPCTLSPCSMSFRSFFFSAILRSRCAVLFKAKPSDSMSVRQSIRTTPLQSTLAPPYPESNLKMQKERDRPFHDSRSPPNACYSIYPLVTTGAAGGGAFPLPKNGPPYCAQPATVSVSATAVSNASTFIEPPFVMTRQLDQGGTPPLVPKRHSEHL